MLAWETIAKLIAPRAKLITKTINMLLLRIIHYLPFQFDLLSILFSPISLFHPHHLLVIANAMYAIYWFVIFGQIDCSKIYHSPQFLSNPSLSPSSLASRLQCRKQAAPSCPIALSGSPLPLSPLSPPVCCRRRGTSIPEA